MSERVLKQGLFALYGVALVAVTVFAANGYSYYTTPLQERPRHEDYWELKPGGSVGHSLGVVGSSLMVLMLIYSVRKRARFMRRLGELRHWLHFHIFCGVVGPLLVILHSSFKVRGLVALSFWSMITVALSGFLGRYLYRQIPRRRSGDELTLSDTQELSADLERRLVEEFALDPRDLEKLSAIASEGLAERKGALAVFLALPWQGLRLRWRLRRLVRDLGADRATLKALRAALVKRAMLERRIRMWTDLHRLFYYWHLLHKPFAVIMYVFMVLHIGVAIATGYGVL